MDKQLLTIIPHHYHMAGYKKKKISYLQLCIAFYHIFGKCPKLSYTKVYDKMAYTNSADPDQIAPKEQSDQGLHCLPFHQLFSEKKMHKKQDLGQKRGPKKYPIKCLNIYHIYGI